VVIEPGWDASWNEKLPQTASAWDAYLACGAENQTWTTSDDRMPMNCISWYDVHAFCIWDDAFLPSEAEWNYAAAGGAQQRSYPWGATQPGTDSKLAIYGCYYMGNGTCPGNLAAVGSATAGNGKFGQSDLEGNVMEPTLDSYYYPYFDPCVDCTNAASTGGVVFRGSDFAGSGPMGGGPDQLLVSYRGFVFATDHYVVQGGRCARTP
jgi:formylglycine-generating enzyme required for sulfatase activity